MHRVHFSRLQHLTVDERLRFSSLYSSCNSINTEHCSSEQMMETAIFYEECGQANLSERYLEFARLLEKMGF